jgi:hypothetical protein
MALDHTYIMRFTYSNLSQGRQQSWTESLLLRKRNSRLHPQHTGWPICGSQSSFSPPHNNWSSGESHTSRRQATRITWPIYQHAISTFNTCSREPTHRSLTDTGGGYSLVGAGFPHHTPRPSQPVVSVFHLRALPGLQFNHKPSMTTKV